MSQIHLIHQCKNEVLGHKSSRLKIRSLAFDHDLSDTAAEKINKYLVNDLAEGPSVFVRFYILKSDDQTKRLVLNPFS